MPDRWIRFCRRFVPEPLRSDAFDPTVHDLHQDWLARRLSPASAVARGTAALRLRLAVLLAAIECRGLAASRVRPAADGRSSRRWVPAGLVLRSAIRIFAREPALTAVVVITLALGTGANLAVFRLVNQFLLAPIAAAEPRDLVRVFGLSSRGATDVVSYPNYTDVRDRLTRLDLAAHAQPTARVGGVESGELRTVELVSDNFFRVLGRPAILGRLIDDRDRGPEGATPVVVVSETWWRTRLGSQPDVIGQAILINSTTFRIVGVAPRGFRGTYAARQVDLWAPLTMHDQVRPRGQRLAMRGWGWLSMIGRLRDGAGGAVAQAEVDAAIETMRRGGSVDPAAVPGMSVQPAAAMSEADRRALVPAVTAIYALTCLLLLVTCANLAGLMQARLADRRRSLAVRRSLGATSGRVAGEWMTESMVLSVAGGGAGLGVAALLGWLLGALPIPAELVGDLSVQGPTDWRVLVYAVGLSLLTGLLVGLIPSIRAGRLDPNALLKGESGAVASGRHAMRGRRAAVFIQVAASVVLLVVAGLLTTGVGRQLSFDPGFETGRLAVLDVDLRRQGLARGEWAGATAAVLERLRALPGVIAAGISTHVPLELGQDRLGFVIPGFTPPDGRRYVSIDVCSVNATYFDALGAKFVQGGPWMPGSGAMGVVVNETAARTFWPSGDAVGNAIALVGGPSAIVSGVVRDTLYYEVGEAPRPFVFTPAEADPPASFIIIVRTAGEPRARLREFALALPAVDRRLAPSHIGTFEDLRAVPLFPARLLSAAALAFGGLAFFLTALGLYGVVATSVSQRTREIGVRMALGARPSTVVRGVVRDALAVTLAGALAGFGAAYAAAAPLSEWLYGVGRFDIAVYVMVAAATVAMALTAAALPARRAASVDPVQALRT